MMMNKNNAPQLQLQSNQESQEGSHVHCLLQRRENLLQDVIILILVLRIFLILQTWNLFSYAVLRLDQLTLYINLVSLLNITSLQ